MPDAFIEGFLANFDDSRFPGDFLQRYELMECLSHNEIGETLLVKDRQTGEYDVAKCYTDKSLLSHTSENDLLKKMHHAGLPTYIGEYQNEEMLCVVREFAQGKPLDKLAKEIKFTQQQAIAFVVQLCDILMYLHGQTPSIIHRDIKPQNIIVNEEGKITLIDFNISRTYDESSREDTLCFGTRHYAAPEQYGFSQTDCRTDIFSLGILLCWLLTGSVDVEQAKKTISNHGLVQVINKCTAFDPKDRYKNAAQVRDALTGRVIQRRILSLFPATLVILSVILLFTNFSNAQSRQPNGITFREPLIEKAVRLSLRMDEIEAITEQDLLSINELFVFGDQAAANENAFNKFVDSFANNGASARRGNISALDDLAKLKNLRRISLVYQNITDLTPLSGHASLETLDLRHNPLDDVKPISRVASLRSLTLFDTDVSDLSALHSCPHLSILDAGDTLITSIAALDGLDALQILMIRKSPLQSLDQIETHPLLERIYLSGTQVIDLSPLINLPRLKLVELDEKMRPAAEAIAVKAQFTIVYQ